MKAIPLTIGLVLLFAGAVRAAEPPQIENHKYTSWAKFKPGTAIVMRNYLPVFKGTKVVDHEYELRSVEKDKVILKTWEYTYFDGGKTQSLAYWTEIPRMITPAKEVTKPLPVGKTDGNVEEGKETIAISGVEFKATWYLNVDKDFGAEMESKVWVCDAMPGDIVKTEVGRKGQARTVTEVVVEYKPAK